MAGLAGTRAAQRRHGALHLAGVKHLQLAVLVACQLLLLGTLVGLYRRQRMRRLWLLPIHLITMVVAISLELSLPEVFWVWRVWAARELALHALSLGIVAEVAWRAFANLPIGRRRARLVLALALLIPLGLVVATPWHSPALASATWLYVLVAEVLPRLTYGAGFVCMALVWAMARNLVPPEPMHASVLLGLGSYLFVYSVSLGMQGQQGAPSVLVYIVTPLAYTLLLGFWVWIAWRDELEPEAPAEVRRKLQPWRS